MFHGAKVHQKWGRREILPWARQPSLLVQLRALSEHVAEDVLRIRHGMSHYVETLRIPRTRSRYRPPEARPNPNTAPTTTEAHTTHSTLKSDRAYYDGHTRHGTTTAQRDGGRCVTNTNQLVGNNGPGTVVMLGLSTSARGRARIVAL